MNEADVINSLEITRDTIRCVQLRASELGVKLRNPPPEPTTCCARGCNGCVWEGYYASMVFWQEDADQMMNARQAIPPALGPERRMG